MAEEVAERLREQITTGRFGEGERLPVESGLSAIFGVGRSTVREAVRILVDQGYLAVYQGRGTFVKSNRPARESWLQRVQRADVREVYEVRKLLEPAIARKAAEHRTERDMETIRRYVGLRSEFAAAGALEACIEADIGFHKAVAEAAHNEILAELYKTVAVHLQASYHRIYGDACRFAVSQPLHEELVRHIEAGDTEKAAAAAERFWEGTGAEK